MKFYSHKRWSCWLPWDIFQVSCIYILLTVRVGYQVYCLSPHNFFYHLKLHFYLSYFSPFIYLFTHFTSLWDRVPFIVLDRISIFSSYGLVMMILSLFLKCWKYNVIIHTWMLSHFQLLFFNITFSSYLVDYYIFYKYFYKL